MLKDLGLKRLGILIATLVLSVLLIFGWLIFQANASLEVLIKHDIELAQQRAGLEQQRSESIAETQQLLHRYTELGTAYEQAINALESKGFRLLNEVMAFASHEKQLAETLSEGVLDPALPVAVKPQSDKQRQTLDKQGLTPDEVNKQLRVFNDKLKIDYLLKELEQAQQQGARKLDSIIALAGLDQAAQDKLKRFDRSLASAVKGLRKAYIKYDLTDHRIGLRLERYQGLQTDRIGLLMAKVQGPAAAHANTALAGVAEITTQGQSLVARQQQISAQLQQVDEQSKQVGSQTEQAQIQRQDVLGSVQQRILSLMLVMVGMLVVLGMLARQLLGKRIIALYQAMRGISRKGDLRLRLQADGKDELGQISADFNSFAANIEQVVAQVDQQVELLNGAGQHMTESSRRDHQNTGQLKQGIGQIQQALTELESQSESMAGSAQHTQQAANEASTLVNDCAPVVQSSLRASNLVSESAVQASEKMSQLNNAAEQIHQVLSVIGDIAEQTNLLALNAAIEAARAGEQGRGFAVVADEVRALAAKTQGSTQQVEKQLAQLSSSTQQAVDSITAMSSRSGESRQAAETVHQALLQITALVIQISEGNDQIAQGTGQQQSAAQQITSSLHQIETLLLETEQGVIESEQISDDLSQMVSSLSSITSTFKSA
ncbi:MAG: methyl-accepting chemotaxis protein [Halopseudomonas sp.]